MATLPQLLAHRKQLAIELEDLDREANELREQLSAIDDELSSRFDQLASALGLEKPKESPVNALASLVPTKVVAGAEIDDWIHLVLMEQGPMRPKQIWEAIIAKGVEVSGRDPVNNVSARLSNSHRFYKLESGTGWWIKGEPAPQDKIKDLIE